MPIILVWNINQPKLCNSTQWIVKKLMNYLTETTIHKGWDFNPDCLIMIFRKWIYGGIKEEEAGKCAQGVTSPLQERAFSGSSWASVSSAHSVHIGSGPAAPKGSKPVPKSRFSQFKSCQLQASLRLMSRHLPLAHQALRPRNNEQNRRWRHLYYWPGEGAFFRQIIEEASSLADNW